MQTPMYIGVVGRAVAGKSTAVAILEDKGFLKVSLSDILREKLQARNLAVSEDALYALGNEMRTKFGPAAIMREALNNASERTVFDCIHGMAELRWLQDRGAVIVGIDADPGVRYERALKRVEEGDRHENYGDLQDFLSAELNEVGRDRFRCNPSDLLDRADIVIKNNGTIDELRMELEEWLASLDGRSSSSS